MKALSLHPFYAVDIACGDKTDEFRSWQTPYRGDLLICSSQYNDGSLFPRGYALCIVELYGIDKGQKGYSWHLCNLRPIVPFKVKGKLHLFEVDDHLIEPIVCDVPCTEDILYQLWEEMGIVTLD